MFSEELTFGAWKKRMTERSEVSAACISQISKAVLRFHAFLRGRSSYYCVEYLRKFLLCLIDADTFFSAAAAEEADLKQGVYSNLADTKLWVNWTHRYCQFVSAHEHLWPSTNFNDYELYRNITQRNSCGALLCDERARSEYDFHKDLGACERATDDDSAAFEDIDCVNKFEAFVLFTLVASNINSAVVYAFSRYVDSLIEGVGWKLDLTKASPWTFIN